MTPPGTIAWKVLTAAEFAAMQMEGSTRGAPIDLADGYVHMSTSDQLEETLAKHFSGQENLVLLGVDLTTLGEAVRWEPARGDTLFPHLYAALPLSAVIAHGPLARDGEGNLKLPVSS